MYQLFVFPTPPGARATLRTDSGYEAVAVPKADPDGRPGLCFDSIPVGHPNGNGAEVNFSAEGKSPLKLRAILLLKDGEIPWPIGGGRNAALLADDFHLPDIVEKIVIIEKPCDPTDPPHSAKDPMGIINEVFKTGKFNLATKEGCGKFTEECCKQLHERHHQLWGHIRKSGAQNQFNGHAVDAIQLLAAHSDGTKAGIYDIISSSESTDAKPAFNFAGDPRTDLWYYPA